MQIQESKQDDILVHTEAHVAYALAQQRTVQKCILYTAQQAGAAHSTQHNRISAHSQQHNRNHTQITAVQIVCA